MSLVYQIKNWSPSIYQLLIHFRLHHSCSSTLQYTLALSLRHQITTITRCFCDLHCPSYAVIHNHFKAFSISAPAHRQQQSEKLAPKMAKLLSGKEVSDEIRSRLKKEVSQLPIKPLLAIIQIGKREDSDVYIRMKKNYAESIGVDTKHFQFPRNISQELLAMEVKNLNQDSSVHGIIVQLPFDSEQAIDTHYIMNLISPQKDVDGLTVANAGSLLHGKICGHEGFIPCTPYGCLELIKRSGIKIEGSKAVVIGRSKIVGSPMAQLLLWNNATVTVCHSHTKNLPEVCKSADILVVAIGKPLFVKKNWIKPGAVVIDCGISSIPDASKKSGQRLVGDVDFCEAKEVASYITPVPGGVGPMTVAMLIANTVESAKRIAVMMNDNKSRNDH